MSKALNFNEGKVRPSLILKDMHKSFNALLEVREMGCKKYDRLNWSLSIGKDDSGEFLADNLDSIYRHLNAYSAGEHKDPESGCLHMAQVAVRCLFALEYYLNKDENVHDNAI